MRIFSVQIYNNYSDYLKKLYGKKVYKLPIAIPTTCPNRDGTLGYDGCAFCGEIGAGYENLPSDTKVLEQIKKNKEHIVPKFKAEKFIAYFQNFSNTYLPLLELKNYLEEACTTDVVRLAISTRPDCINEQYLKMFKEISKNYNVDISIELGLQTVNYKNLTKLNRGHTLAEYLDTMQMINAYDFYSCTHIILNLPDDDMADVIETAKIVSAMRSTEVKLHALYIVKNTALAELYSQGKLHLISKDEYVLRVIEFLKYLSPAIAVQRLIGRAPDSHTLFSNWSMGWWRIKEEIEQIMYAENIQQGMLFDYLSGKSVKKFT